MTVRRCPSLFVLVLALLPTLALGAGCADDPKGSRSKSDAVQQADDEPTDREGDSENGEADDTQPEEPAEGDDNVGGTDQPEVCVPLAEVVDMNDEIGKVFDSGNAITQDALDDMLAQIDDLIDIYDEAIAVAPPEIVDDLEALSASTLLLAQAFSTLILSGDVDSQLTEIFANDEFADAALEGGRAALQLDEFTEPECGFTLSNQE